MLYVPSAQRTSGLSCENTPSGLSHDGTTHACTIQVVMAMKLPPAAEHCAAVTPESAGNKDSVPRRHTPLWRCPWAVGPADPPGAADRFAAGMGAGPVDVGSPVRKGIRRWMLEGTLEGPPCDGDGGNGAAMRVLPVALATLADGALLAEWAVAQARLTHHHPLSDAGTVHVGELVHLAILGRGKPRLRHASDAFAARLPPFAFEPYRGLATGYVVDTLQTVLHAFHSTRGFEECLVAAVNRGGDADTTGAIAGAVAGAYYGEEALPARWLRRLDRAVREEVVALAERLVALSPLARGEPPRDAGPG